MDSRPLNPVDLIFAMVGMVLHGVLLVLVLASGLVAPLWAVLALLAVWAGLLGYALLTWRRRRWITIAAPVAGVAFWLAALFLGGELLGWTA